MDILAKKNMAEGKEAAAAVEAGISRDDGAHGIIGSEDVELIREGARAEAVQRYTKLPL